MVSKLYLFVQLVVFLLGSVVLLVDSLITFVKLTKNQSVLGKNSLEDTIKSFRQSARNSFLSQVCVFILLEALRQEGYNYQRGYCLAIAGITICWYIGGGSVLRKIKGV